jgi:hypothetical protein
LNRRVVRRRLRVSSLEDMETTYQLAVSGPLPGRVRDALRRRFGNVPIVDEPGRTLIGGFQADQATLRAIVTLLWDVGGEVILLSSSPSAQPAPPAQPRST